MPKPHVLPHDIAAEASLLGSILVDKEALVEVVENLKPEHFYLSRNAFIYEAMCSLYEREEPIDLVTLASELKRAGTLEKAGNTDYLFFFNNGRDNWMRFLTLDNFPGCTWFEVRHHCPRGSSKAGTYRIGCPHQ